MIEPAVCACAVEQPAAPWGGGAAGTSAGSAGVGAAVADASPRHKHRPAAWLRRVLRGAQAVAEDRPEACAADEAEDDDASDDGGGSEDDCTGFGSLPEHLLERILSHLRCANRKHHFAICGVNRQWRRLGRAMFFARPWEVAHLICHPTQLFCLSPRNVTGSRSGLLKCFVRREHGPGGKRFTFHIGKDAAQPQRSRFLMAAKPGGRDEMLLFLNSRCKGPPCARLRCNVIATQYKLMLADDLQLEPTGSQTVREWKAAACSGGALGPSRAFSRLQSWGEEAAAEAVAEARRAAQAARRGEEQRSGGSGSGSGATGGGGGGCTQPPLTSSQLGVDCFAELRYQARVKGFMQPRRMRVALPSPKLLFYDQALPHLSRRASEPLPPALLPPSPPSSAGGSLRGAAAARRTLSSPAACSIGTPPSPETGPSAAAESGGDVAALPAGGAGAGRLARLLQCMHLRRSHPQPNKLLRQQKTVPVDETLQPVVLQNKAPHWNEGLRCWCLNFRGRVKLASVKNFQLVRGGDPTERVVMQFGKAEQDAFILDFNPMVLTAVQAFGCVLSTF